MAWLLPQRKWRISVRHYATATLYDKRCNVCRGGSERETCQQIALKKYGWWFKSPSMSQSSIEFFSWPWTALWHRCSVSSLRWYKRTFFILLRTKTWTRFSKGTERAYWKFWKMHFLLNKCDQTTKISQGGISRGGGGNLSFLDQAKHILLASSRERRKEHRTQRTGEKWLTLSKGDGQRGILPQQHA